MFSAFRAAARASQPLSRSYVSLHTPAWRTARLAAAPLVPARPTPTHLPSSSTPSLTRPRHFHTSPPALVTLNQAVRRKHRKKPARPTSPLLEGNTQKKGVISTIFVAKPKKPNSAKRKVARVKLTNGRTVQAYVPGEGHTLQEHSVVLVRGGRAQDLPGVRYKLVRGSLDFSGVVNRRTARSKYGAKKPKQ